MFIATRLQHHDRIPHRPSNEDRVRADRAVAPVELGNSWFPKKPAPFNGCDVVGVNVVERPPANNHEARRLASANFPKKSPAGSSPAGGRLRSDSADNSPV